MQMPAPDAGGAKACGCSFHDVSEMATGQRGYIDSNDRRHVATKYPAPHLDSSGLLRDVSCSAAHEGVGQQQAVPSSLDETIGRWCRAESRRIFGSRPVAGTGEPPLFQRLLSVLLHMTGAVAERERLEKGDDNRFLVGGKRGEAGRVPIPRPPRKDQRLPRPRPVRPATGG